MSTSRTPRRFTLTLAALAAAGVMALGAAHAGAVPAAPPPNASFLMEAAGDRSGQLEVAGSGRVILVGRVALQGELSNRGVLQVVDRAGDAQVFVAGRQVVLRRGRGVVRRTAGIVFVAGSNVSVTSSDPATRLFVAGNATVRLAGRGVHRINLGQLVAWPRSSFRLSGATLRTGAQVQNGRERGTGVARARSVAKARTAARRAAQARRSS